jgi:hypothetical protein
MRRPQTAVAVGVVAMVVSVALLVPIGKHLAYPKEVLADSEFVRACSELPESPVAQIVGAPVTDRFQQLPRPNIEVENLFPSISRDQCSFVWSTPCPSSSLKTLVLYVTDEPDSQQGLGRFTYNELLLQQDSSDINGFHTFALRHRRGYELAIGSEVLVRMLDTRFILDLHAITCRDGDAKSDEALIAPLVSTFHFPVTSEVVKRNTQHIT